MANISTATWTFEVPDSAEAERYRLQRDMLVGLVWSSPTTQERFAALRRTTHLNDSAQRLRRAIHRKASDASLQVAEHALFEKMFADKTRKLIGTTLDKHVRGLFGKGVPWLAQELIQLFVAQVFASAQGRGFTRRSSADMPPPSTTPGPAIPAGATLREQQRILRAYYKAMTARPPMQKKGRAPKSKAASVQRDAAWYYLHVVEGQSIHSLANQYKALISPDACGSYDGRALIQRAIRNTARRLQLPATRSSVIS